MKMFIFITMLGRTKPFLLEGVLIYYFGPPLVEIWHKYSDFNLWFVAGAIVITVAALYAVKRLLKTGQQRCL